MLFLKTCQVTAHEAKKQRDCNDGCENGSAGKESVFESERAAITVGTSFHQLLDINDGG